MQDAFILAVEFPVNYECHADGKGPFSAIYMVNGFLQPGGWSGVKNMKQRDFKSGLEIWFGLVSLMGNMNVVVAALKS